MISPVDREPTVESIENLVANLERELASRKEQGLDTILFIPITGGEGCGKTTLLNALTTHLDRQGIPNTTLKILDGILRQVILSNEAADFSDEATVLTLQAAMAESAKKLAEICPAGTGQLIVFVDRSPWDTAVYQDLAQGRSIDQATDTAGTNLFFFSKRGIPVTNTVYLKLDPKIGLARKQRQGGDEVTRFEEMDFAYHQAVASGFDQLANRFPGSFEALDGTQSPKELQRQFLNFLIEYLESNQGRPIVGQPPSFEQIKVWLAKDSLRAFRMLSSIQNIRFGGTEIYLEYWRSMAFNVRDNESWTERDIQNVIAEFLENKLVGLIAGWSMGQAAEFFESIRSTDAAELKEHFWRHVNSLKEAFVRETRNRERIARIHPDIPWFK